MDFLYLDLAFFRSNIIILNILTQHASPGPLFFFFFLYFPSIQYFVGYMCHPLPSFLSYFYSANGTDHITSQHSHTGYWLQSLFLFRPISTMMEKWNLFLENFIEKKKKWEILWCLEREKTSRPIFQD